VLAGGAANDRAEPGDPAASPPSQMINPKLPAPSPNLIMKPATTPADLTSHSGRHARLLLWRSVHLPAHRAGG
jgi:hypothetical protein